ncbi:MAG: LysR family transcriptional regulator [Pseudodesulfovibrio sp.]|uniref:DNA-binding transcriptional LysR family regulator n=2 Tax=Pseudodesulfovibrio indicus TaxID=1716143 RepID=A0AA94PKF4_9BACT|nr:LysR family transcriptional regulator [Pseudodesulfovibrio indicus]TDT86347.1 DNA-binding transcriptional LysR family regulator [Pseudodesulfovibrio indicus]
MNETSLKVFMAVCETGSFTKAASELFITQPAVSRHVQGLEHLYGVELFERRGRRIVLTANGEILRAKARELFALHAEVESLFDEIVELKRGRISIAASASIATYILPPAIAAFRKQFPGVTIEQLSGNTHAVKQLVGSGEADIGFGGAAGVETRQLIRTLVHRERLEIVARTDSAISRKKVVTPEDMLEYDFVWREKGTQTRLYVRELFKNTPLQEPGVVVQRVATAKRFAQVEGYLTALPYSAVKREVEDGRLAILNVPGFDFTMDFNAFVSAGRRLGTAAQAFLQHLLNREDFTHSRNLRKLLQMGE